MVRPAVASDGHTYERTAIRRWLLGTKMTSPMTNEQLENRRLIPSHAMNSVCAEALSNMREAQRAEVLAIAAESTVLEDRQIATLCSNVVEADVHRGCVRRWTFAMDGDSPEDVTRLLVASTRRTLSKGGVPSASALGALQRTSAVCPAAACSAGAPECALEVLNAGTLIVEALKVVSVTGGGSVSSELLTIARGHLDTPSGLAALAALVPSCTPEELESCRECLCEALRSPSAAAAMKPAAAMSVSKVIPAVQDSMAEAMKRFHSCEAVQVAALRALQDEVGRIPKGSRFGTRSAESVRFVMILRRSRVPRRNLDVLGFALTAQLMRAHASGTRVVKVSNFYEPSVVYHAFFFSESCITAQDCAHSLCAALGVFEVSARDSEADVESEDISEDEPEDDED